MKKACILFLAAGILLAFAACGQAPQSNTGLSVYYRSSSLDPEGNVPYLFTVSNYRSLHPEITFTEYDPTNGDISLSPEEAEKRMNADMMAGKGPDLIIDIDTMGLYKKMAAGAFLDLNPLMAREDLLPAGDRNELVLESGVLQGKRYVLPLKYIVPSLTTTEEMMTKLGADASKLDTLEGFIREASKGLAVQPAVRLAGADDSFYMSVFRFPGMIDFETGTLQLENPLFRELAELYRIGRPAERETPASDYPYTQSMLDKETAFLDDSGYWGTTATQLMVLTAGGDTPFIFPLRNETGGNTARVKFYTAISAKTKNAENAWEFLRTFVSQLMSLPDSDMPVKSSAVENHIEYIHKLEKNGAIAGMNEAAQGVSLPDSYYDTLRQYVSEVDSAVLDMEPYGVVTSCFTPYFDGEKSYEECLAAAQDAFELYMSE